MAPITHPSAETLRRDALALAAGVRPELLSGSQAADAVRSLATAEKALATVRMFLAVRVARTDAWRGQGHGSAADWLAAQTGTSVREASAQLATAKRAERLPKTKEAMEQGKLSPDQADAVTGAAAADPTAEDELLDAAEQDTTARLKEKAASRRAAATDSKTKERRANEGRTRQLRTHPDGTFSLHLRGPAADGARLAALLRPYDEQIFRSGRGSGTRDTYDNRCYDAMMALLATCRRPRRGRPKPGAMSGAEAGTKAGTKAGMKTGTESDGEPGGESNPESYDPVPSNEGDTARLPGGDNTKVIVRIDHQALARGHTVAGETCEIAGLGPVPVSTVRSLMDDAFIAAVITKGRDVLTVAHLGRRLSAHQRTALEWTGIRCSNRACNRTIAIEVDHRTPWATNPETRLDNQDPLCPDCHRRKTHHGWNLEPGNGPRRFLPPASRGDDSGGDDSGGGDDRERATWPAATPGRGAPLDQTRQSAWC